MPGRDGSGPRGAGPMTGRGEGFCVEYAEPGRGADYWSSGGSAGDLLQTLEAQAEYLEDALNDVKNRIRQLSMKSGQA